MLHPRLVLRISLAYVSQGLPTLGLTIVDNLLDKSVPVLIGAMLEVEGVEGLDGGRRHFNSDGRV